jgi:hypothetical protein
LILAGNFLALAVSLYISQTSLLKDEMLIPKNSWQQGSYALDLVAETDDENLIRDITVIVEPVSLNEDEITALALAAFTELPKAILGNNPTLSAITTSLNLVTGLAGYPFTITWVIDNPSLVKVSGRIDNRTVSSEGEVVILTAHLHYRDQETEYHFQEDILVCLQSPPDSVIDAWTTAIMEAIAAIQREDVFADFFYLPEEISGIAVKWQERTTPDGLYLWLAVLAAAVLAFIFKDQDLQKKVMKRDKQIDRDYPELVRKLALYLGAGTTLRGAWKRVAADYQGIKAARGVKYLYEEMLYSIREMENGIAEKEVYERFSKRVGIAKYRKLAGLFNNHLQMGNKNLLLVLREEVMLALEDRKKAARTIGEEMSTKLLLPMMLMLVIVMVIIMIPAFQMF